MIFINYVQCKSILRQTELFSALNEDEINIICDDAAHLIKEYEKEQIIHIQNEICEYIDIVLTGCVAVKK